MEPLTLGRRLRAAREQRGLNQQSAAEAIDIPRTALTNIEAGTRSVSTVELMQLASLYGRQPAAFLSDDDETMEELSIFLPRALPEMQGSERFGAAVQRMVDLCKVGAHLRRQLDQHRDAVVPNYRAALHSTTEAIRQAEMVAAEERRRLGLGNAPLNNLAEIITAEGIWVAAAELPDDFSGLFLSHADVGLAILVNGGHSLVRRRFSYAHEYAHALFDREEVIAATRRTNASALVEKRANAFAAAFLMPAEGVSEQLQQIKKGYPSRQTQIIFDVANNSMSDTEIRPPSGSQTITYQDVATIAKHFLVSYEAAAWRMRSLNRISQVDVQELISKKDFGNDYLKMLQFTDLLDDSSPETGEREREQELRSELIRLATEAFRREEITLPRLREIAIKLDLPANEVVSLARALTSGP